MVFSWKIMRVRNVKLFDFEVLKVGNDFIEKIWVS